MQFSTLLLTAFTGLAAAQYGYGDAAASSSGSSAGTPSSTSSAAATSFTSTSGQVVHKVAVGKNGLAFTPDSFAASPGDAVEFHFWAKTHSVASSSFAKPCAPVNASSFWSGGFTTTTTTTANTTVWTLQINDTTPIWLYCGYPGHCEAGMVGVINPPSSTSKTLALYAAAAKEVTNTTTPAHPQGGVRGSAASTSGSSSSTTSNSPSASASGNDAGAIKATMGVIAGFASIAFAALIL